MSDLAGAPVALTEEPIRSYLDRLASAAPAPGGGSVAALTAAQGAALLAMVANLTVGKPRFRQHDAEVGAILAEAERLRADCAAIVDRDAEVLRALIAAYRLPRATPEEGAARAATLQARLREATDVPLIVLRAAAALPPLCRRLLPLGNPTAVSDIGVAATCAGAAYRGAELSVLINLGHLTDSAYVEAVRLELAERGADFEETVGALLGGVRERL